jgi:hypothetical protein
VSIEVQAAAQRSPLVATAMPFVARFAPPPDSVFREAPTSLGSVRSGDELPAGQVSGDLTSRRGA